MGTLQLIIFALVTLLHFSNASPRIAGGQNGTISQFPYLAQLHRRFGTSSDFEYHCTGTLVSSTRLVTAAHCFDGQYNNQPSQWRIRVGATYIEGDENQAYSFNPTRILIHEAYDPQTYDHDIAVVAWQFPLWPSSTVNFIDINYIEVPAHSQVTVAGWGGVDIGGTISESLQFANIPTVDLPVCRINYAWHSRFVTENMMCAGIQGRGSCTNDRGLPLIYSGQLAGVSSWRLGCGNVNQPGVFAVVIVDDHWLLDAIHIN